VRVDDESLDRGGIALGVGAYAVWGLFPAFWALLAPATPPEVLAHRILWTALLMSVVLTAVRGWRHLRVLGLRGWSTVAVAAVFIAVNWGVFIYSVSIGHVVEAALGYYMTPLVSVFLAVVVLRERVGAAPWVALGLATAAIVVIAVGAGAAPWLSLVLAVSFGVYGLIKKTIPLPATASLTGEGLVLAPIAAATVVVLELTGSGTFVDHGPWHLLLMVAAGPVTALPLLLYGAAARRIPLATLGVLMYLNPTLQFLWGVLAVGEQMPPSRWIGFVLVWLALAVFTVDIVRRARRGAPQPVRSTV
jgi:chloramphenicol-sensitive protein RarD